MKMDESSEDSVAFVLKYLLLYCAYGFTIVQCYHVKAG